MCCYIWQQQCFSSKGWLSVDCTLETKQSDQYCQVWNSNKLNSSKVKMCSCIKAEFKKES